MCTFCKVGGKPPDGDVFYRVHALQPKIEAVRSEREKLKRTHGNLLRAYTFSTETYLVAKVIRLLAAVIPNYISLQLVTGIFILLLLKEGSLALFSVLAAGDVERLRMMFQLRPRRAVISQPPGQRLLRFAEIFFSPKTVRLTFQPLIADWQFEHFEALKGKLPLWRLQLMSVRYYWYYAQACGLSKLARFFRAAAKP